jgi:BlaI family transcriptional regulator, penicillinase repressor
MGRPRQPGLTENELDVMKVLWGEAPLKVSEILQRLVRRPRPAYTSLLTLIQVMEKKGYLGHVKDGKAYTYSPKLQKNRFAHSELKRVAKRLFDAGPGSLVLNLVKNEQLTKEEIEELKQLLSGEV